MLGVVPSLPHKQSWSSAQEQRYYYFTLLKGMYVSPIGAKLSRLRVVITDEFVCCVCN